MIPLIGQLIDEHQTLIQLLNKAKDIDILTNEGFRFLNESKDLFFSHHLKEEKELYPVLYKNSRKDKDLASLLHNLSHDMASLTTELDSFFKKYSDLTNFDRIEFNKDIIYVIIKLQTRLAKEEKILFKKFNEIVTTNPGLWTHIRLKFQPTHYLDGFRYKILDGIRYRLSENHDNGLSK